jgi:hypothetical protein
MGRARRESLIGLALLVLSILSSARVAAQVSETRSPFRPLDLPAPNAYRAADGRPGPAYWQQRVDYRIEATLDPAENTVSGEGVIVYHNRSPQALPYLWLHLEQNLCDPLGDPAKLVQPSRPGDIFDFTCRPFGGGLALSRVTADGQPLPHSVYGTTVRVDLPTPVRPGERFELELEWHFRVIPGFANRMGHDGPHYQIALWYPRVAVYDDVAGWNTDPFIGNGEFYLEYGSFDVALTVPRSHIVAATGALQNPKEVLTTAQRRRLERAARSQEPVPIIAAGEAGSPQVRPAGDDDWLTWRFQADSVRDFAFAAGPRLRWDASSYGRVMIHTLYRPEAELWPEANRMARHAIRVLSESWYPYPYAHATVVEGPVPGMEYPMVVFLPPTSTRETLYWLVAHELGHQWYPMIVGSNERRHAWMDEGFTTFVNIAAIEDYFAGEPYGETFWRIPLDIWPERALPAERPVALPPPEHVDLFWTQYRKASLMMHTLRLEVLGEERFDRAFRAYTEAWAFRHPTPADFFRMMEDVSGMNLDWFWRGWLYTTAQLDQGIAGIETDAAGDRWLVLENHGSMVMPAELRLTWTDGTSETVRLPVQMWYTGDRFLYRLPRGQTLAEAELDPRRRLPDMARENNRWKR